MELEDHKEQVPHNLRKQLALAVRSIQWSYAIFWSIASSDNGRLEWYDGYYNGEIKTRKTVQSTESNTVELGLQRTDQLQELYESLSLGETNHQAKRPTAALIPEDLSNAEWYFLVCMSFNFDIGQGLAGMAMEKGEAIWLCNAHRADTAFFSRSLLAKSAAVKTIVCFPHLGGVVELGTSKLVQEDMSLIHQVKMTFLNNPNIDPENIFQVPGGENMPGDRLDHLLDCPTDEHSPNNCSDDFADNLLRERSNLVDGVEGETASQMLNFQFLDDAISNCLNKSVSSADCVSQTYEDPEPIIPQLEAKGARHGTQECNRKNTHYVKQMDTHYHSVLSSLLKSSHQLILGPYFKNANSESSFVSWMRDGFIGNQVLNCVAPQMLLKKVLIEVPRLHINFRSEGAKQSCNSRQEVDETDRNHVLSERKRREKINERFLILGSIIPSGGKVDKVSILDHTIEYIRELERKMVGLESYKEAMELERPLDAVERTSDNYGSNNIGHVKKPSTSKRDISGVDKTGGRNKRTKLRDSSADDVTVQVSDKEVFIESQCSWTENMLIQFMGAISKLRLDIQTFDYSQVDGILYMTMKAKCKGLKAPSASVITQALHKVISQEMKKLGVLKDC